MEQAKGRRLGRDGWRALLGRFGGSGLTVQGFCQREGVSVASFYLWRSKFADSPAQLPVAGTRKRRAAEPEFLDLGTLGGDGQGCVDKLASHRFELCLDLGGGVKLHLVRS